MEFINNESNENQNQSKIKGTNHDFNIKIRNLVKECEDAKIPIFVAYYLNDKGFKYRATLPQEVGITEIENKEVCNKFKKFLQVVMNYDKNDYLPNFEKTQKDDTTC